MKTLIALIMLLAMSAKAEFAAFSVEGEDNPTIRMSASRDMSVVITGDGWFRVTFPKAGNSLYQVTVTTDGEQIFPPIIMHREDGSFVMGLFKLEIFDGEWMVTPFNPGQLCTVTVERLK